MTEPPGTLRVLRLLSGLAVRRAFNRLSAFAGFRRRKDAAKRAATPGKRRRSYLLFVVLTVPYLFLIGSLTAQMIGRLGDAFDRRDAERTGRISVSKTTRDYLVEAEDALAKFRAELAPASDAERKRFEEYATQWDNNLRQMFTAEYQQQTPGRPRDVEAGAPEAVDRWMKAFDKEGAKGFVARAPRTPFSGAGVWPKNNERAVVGALGAVLALILVCLVFQAFGGRDEPIGAVGWSLEWLLTFPVGARVLFLAKLAEYVATGLLAWMLLVPFLTVVFWCAHFGWWSVPLALAGALHGVLLVASVRLVGETWLRKAFRPSFLRNVQAVLVVLYMLAFFALMFLAYRPQFPAWLVAGLRAAGLGFAFVPGAWPILLCLDGYALPVAVGMLGLAVAVPIIAVRLSAWLIRDGLVTAGGQYEGKRTVRAAAGGEKRDSPLNSAKGTVPSFPFFRGILGKETRLLLRDRGFFVQTLIVPLFVIGLQLVVNDELLRALLSGSGHVATIAFGVGAYVLMFGAFNVLAAEGPALWLLYTFPAPLERVLRRKAILWAFISAFYSVAVIVAALAISRSAKPAALGNMALAVVGVFIYAYVAAGLGVLGVDPLEKEPRRRARPEMVYAYMLLAAMFAYGLYSPSLWVKVGQVTLCSLMAYAIWQKVRDHAPYLLDPTQSPPPTVSLSDGLIAALAFFVLQGTVVLILVANGAMGIGAALLVGFVSAGVVVTVASLYAFRRRKVPGILRAVGLRFDRAAGRTPGRAVRVGLVGGIAAGLLGLVYLRLLDVVEPLRALKEEAQRIAIRPDAGYGWVVVLAVLAAPVFEEYIFRGLVFRGLRRSWSPAVAVLASAGIFAVIHPAISVLPVFLLGVAAAVVFEMSGVLLAPILAHMTYNAIVVILAPGG